MPVRRKADKLDRKRYSKTKRFGNKPWFWGKISAMRALLSKRRADFRAFKLFNFYKDNFMESLTLAEALT